MSYPNIKNDIRKILPDKMVSKTVQTQIRLLQKEESDQWLHSFDLHPVHQRLAQVDKDEENIQ